MPDPANCSWCANVANLVPVYQPERRSTRRLGGAGNMRCGLCTSKHIVVLGHAQCGGNPRLCR